MVIRGYPEPSEREQLDHLNRIANSQPERLRPDQLQRVIDDQRNRMGHECRVLNESADECQQFRAGYPCAECKVAAHVPYPLAQTLQQIREKNGFA